jgi:hypothetical protein
MSQHLEALLAAEDLYLRNAGWRQGRDVRRPGFRFTLWVSPHNGDEYAQPGAVKAQKIQDGYLPRPDAEHQPASTL